MTAMGLTAVAVALVVAASWNTDALIERTFKTALDRGTGASPSASSHEAGTAAVSGTEDFWLRKASNEGPPQPALANAPAVGSRITIGAGGADTVLEVVDVRAVNPGLTKTAAPGGNDGTMIMITCRLAAGGEAFERGKPIRFYVNASDDWPALLGAKPSRAS